MRHLRNVLEPLALGAGRLTRDELLMVVGRIAADQSLWRPVVRHDPVRRWYGRLHTSPTLEVWLLGWVGGQDTRLHDHGGSLGALTVVSGALTEQRWVGTGLATRRLRAGSSAGFPLGHVHDVGNPDPTPAVSVHAYSPPLSAMSYYAVDDARLLRRTRSELVEQGTPVA